MARVVSEKCNAKDRSKCRYHGELDHARFAIEDAKERYEEAVKAYNEADPATRDTTRWGTPTTVKNRMRNAKTALNAAQTTFDNFPGEFKKLKAELERARFSKTIDSNVLKELEARVNRVEKRRASEKEKAAEAKRLEKEKTALLKRNAARFEEVKRQVEERENSTDQGEEWRRGFRKAVSGVMLSEGTIVNGPGRHSYGMYFAAYDYDKTAHLKECGALDVYNIKEDSWEEWDFNSMDSNTSSHTEYKVTANVTCKCGHLVDDTLQITDTMSSIYSKVVNF